MNDRSELKACPKCGDAIPAEAPQGLCPKCLLLQASFPTESAGNLRSGTAPPTREELAGAFPQLEILELIGQGGMGFVFKARQPKLDRLVALKILPQSLAGEPAFAERFAREGRLLARLNHPNIVTIYDFGQANGFFYLLMEFVDGVNLRQAMKAGRFTPDQALAIVPRICEALQFAHNESILHRDIKPENILLDAKGRVKIADFGIAKLMGEPQATAKLTESGGALGTAHYIAPEQVENPSLVDHRADIYSLGVVFYEMLTGELPIGRFAPPSENCGVDPRIDELVFRALDKKPERRPQSAGEVKTEIETVATQSASHVSAKSSAAENAPHQVSGDPAKGDTSGAFRERPRRRTLVLAGGIGLALVCVIAMVWIVLPWSQPMRKADGGISSNGSSPGTTGLIKGSNVLSAIGGEVSTNEFFTKTILLTRATNQLVGQSRDTWSVNIWTDAFLQPGETISARVRLGDEALSEHGCHSMLFINSQPEKVGTSAVLGWYFGGAWRKDFGESEAEAALAQLRGNFHEKPLTLTAGKPVALFAVTNSSGMVLAGYAELTRYVPKLSSEKSAATPRPQAILHLRRFMAFLPSISCSAKVPLGYQVRATVNMGQATTHCAVSGKPDEIYTSWFIPPSIRWGSSPGGARDLPAQMNAQRDVLEARFQELQDHGPIPIVLGEPFSVFTITNQAGQVYRAFFELVGPSSARAANEVSAAKPTPASTPGKPAANAALPSIDPATGLTIGGPVSVAIDPATGLPFRTLKLPPRPTNAPAASIPN